MVDGSIVKIQYPVTFENETPTAINKLVVMSKKQAPRSTVWINEAGLDKIRKRMTEFKKSDNDNKRGKSCWTVEYLAQQAYVSQSTIKRLLNKKVPIDQTSAISILDKLGFTCYWAGMEKLWRITACPFCQYLTHKFWANIACANRNLVPTLLDEMEKLFLNTIKE